MSCKQWLQKQAFTLFYKVVRTDLCVPCIDSGNIFLYFFLWQLAVSWDKPWGPQRLSALLAALCLRQIAGCSNSASCCFFHPGSCVYTSSTPPPTTALFPGKKPVTLSVRVSCPDVMFFGALFGTESHKSLRDTRVGRGTDLACAIRRRRRLARGRQWQSSIQHSPERGFLCQFQCHLISAACTFRLCQLFSIHPC